MFCMNLDKFYEFDMTSTYIHGWTKFVNRKKTFM